MGRPNWGTILARVYIWGTNNRSIREKLKDAKGKHQNGREKRKTYVIERKWC